MQLWLCPLLAFLFGSIPFGLIIARAKGINIREHGSGNIGATNVLRVVGKKYGITCLMLDALKGFIPVAIAINLIQIDGRAIQVPLGFLDPWALVLPAAEAMKGQTVQILTALAAVLGHNYSPWVGFKGGKGIATSAGVLLALMPFAVGLLVVVFLAVFLATRYVSVASIVAAAALPLAHPLGIVAPRADPGRHLEQTAVRLHPRHRASSPSGNTAPTSSASARAPNTASPASRNPPMSESKFTSAAILGSGSFGTAMAKLLAPEARIHRPHRPRSGNRGHHQPRAPESALSQRRSSCRKTSAPPSITGRRARPSADHLRGAHLRHPGNGAAPCAAPACQPTTRCFPAPRASNNPPASA